MRVREETGAAKPTASSVTASGAADGLNSRTSVDQRVPFAPGVRATPFSVQSAGPTASRTAAAAIPSPVTLSTTAA
ncbi:MAG: hypothetical protein IPL89_06575 [Acidobacteria bacterium]|nr:hypothetical protein [Acidobacteriota bacterium]